MRILVSNDDGHHSEGIQALVRAMEPLGEVWVVAPETEQSAASHAISLHRPLRIRELGRRWYAVDGTPTDCVYLAIQHIMKQSPPDLVVSGINHGPNLAEDVIYSGTVAAAMEGRLLGFPSIAFSLACGPPHAFDVAARFAASLARSVLEAPPARPFLLSVNVPRDAGSDSYRVTRLGRHTYGVGVLEGKDPRGRSYYWIGGNDYHHDDIPGSDCNTVLKERRISVTPLQPDLTDTARLEEVGGWTVVGFERV